MNLSIEEWAAVAEIIGGAAVLVSLIYLAYQIRQNTKQLEMNLISARLTAFERTVQSSNHIREILITNGEVAKLYQRGMKSYDDLPAEDQFRVNMLFRNVFSEFQSAYVRQITWDNDNRDRSDGQARFLDSLLKQPGIRQWLKREKVDWHPAFKALVDARVAANPEAADAGS